MSESLYDQMVTEIRFLEIAREESKRTVYCEPHREHQIRAAVDQAGVADIITVRASPACPAGELLIVDEGALKAAGEVAKRELLQGLQRQPWRFGGEAS
ncbi:hypothetical protein RVR_8301 [Actinacidiphila reveromycinica]|uniref:Uncharacterized protein n=1 Tax=Actinacidiphila reveromycinica TaxID=659352 RepID=A0A7U3VRQ9_9ACTN|nr:hypothetical protein [Streptomyces sp. SN-593]BBB01061.1 hypothetical protein RVR_8301 [Streptomyces sp. SN-593]